MKHLYKKLSLLVLATLVSTMTMAQSAGEYLVEVVFFGQPSASLVMGTPPDLDWSDNAVKLDETARSDVQSIDPTRFRLSQEARKRLSDLSASGVDATTGQRSGRCAEQGRGRQRDLSDTGTG